MGAPGAKTRYTLIKLLRDIFVKNPRIGATFRKEFVNVEGRPHAGGIDVTLETKDNEGHPNETIITVPWGGIVQAVRVIEAE